MKIAIAQVEAREGEVAGNKERIKRAFKRCADSGSELVIVPELAVSGYPAGWALANECIIESNLAAIQELSGETEQMGMIAGYIDKNPVEEGKKFYVGTALLCEKEVQFVSYKTNLIDYDYFHQTRWFEPAISLVPTKFKNKKFLIGTLEDFFYREFADTVFNVGDEKYAELKRKKFDVVVITAVRPYAFDSKLDLDAMLGKIAAYFKAYVVYANCVGCNGELVFEGNSKVVDPSGKIIATGKHFEEDVINVDVGFGAGDLHGENISGLERLYKAISSGIASYITELNPQKVYLRLDNTLPSFINAAIARKVVSGDSLECVFCAQGELTSGFAASLGIKCSQPVSEIESALNISNTCPATLFDREPAAIRGPSVAPLKSVQFKTLVALAQEVLNKDGVNIPVERLTTGKELASEQAYEKLLSGFGASDAGLAPSSISIQNSGYFINGLEVYRDIYTQRAKVPLFWKF